MNIDEILSKEKKRIDNVKIPDEMEQRLISSLNNKKQSKKNRHLLKIATYIIVILLLTYNIDVVAFYGGRLIGYNQIMNGTLQQLDEMGKGQIIGKGYQFKNGLIINLDGIMIDDNQMLAFYSIIYPNENTSDFNINLSFRGLISSYHMNNGQGELNTQGTEIKWVSSFETPLFFEKNLTFNITVSSDSFLEEGEIKFKLDRNKAMGHTLKQTVNKKIKLDNNTLLIKSILATSTSTVIKGSMGNIFDLVSDEILSKRTYNNILDMDLIANGVPVKSLGSGISTDSKGITFEIEYDALPQDLKSLDIKINSISAEHEVHEDYLLDNSIENKEINILKNKIIINKIYQDKDSTYVTITTEDSTMLSKVYLWCDGKKIELKETINYEHNKLEDGTLMITRTLNFPSSGESYSLQIDRITYATDYDEILSIPIK
ncbi:MAG: DUF4179 domain-containing protein [Eubacteriaceae bacterium]